MQRTTGWFDLEQGVRRRAIGWQLELAPGEGAQARVCHWTAKSKEIQRTPVRRAQGKPFDADGKPALWNGSFAVEVLRALLSLFAIGRRLKAR
jgi:hypothetical protein